MIARRALADRYEYFGDESFPDKISQSRAYNASRHRHWKRRKRVRVDHVTARITEKAPLEVEIAQGPPHAITGTERAEALGESRRAAHTIERRFIGEQHVIGHLGHDVSQSRRSPACRQFREFSLAILAS